MNDRAIMGSTDMLNLARTLIDSSQTAEITCALLRRILPLCESPIEVKLVAALLWLDTIDPPCSRFHPLICCPETEVVHYSGCRLLVPQYHWRDFRIDFAFIDEPLTVFIECDGHDFHQRTKEQAARDRARDRIIQQAGYSILRFTGAEITRDSLACAESIFAFVSDLHIPKEARG
jgi:very-short-patch-repair endonuclease